MLNRTNHSTYISKERSHNESRDFSSYFPALRDKSDLCYFDSAATTQRPDVVLLEEVRQLTDGAANIGRSSHTWATNWDTQFEEGRTFIQSSISGLGRGELIFTSGATHASNLVALSWGAHNLEDGDQVLYCPEDHQSFVAPWMSLQSDLARKGVNIELVPYKLTPSGHVDIEDVSHKLTSHLRLFNLTHVHNMTGAINDPHLFRDLLGKNVLINLDAAQSVSHRKLNLSGWGVDFAMFSGHKMFANFGSGCLWASHRVFDDMKPLFGGGGALSGAQAFEKGTQNLTASTSISTAFGFIDSLGWSSIQNHEDELKQYLFEELSSRKFIELRFAMRSWNLKDYIPLISFTIPGMEAIDVAEFLSEESVYVRSGTMCTGGGDMTRDAVVRVSSHMYNSKDQIDHLVDCLDQIKSFLI